MYNANPASPPVIVLDAQGVGTSVTGLGSSTINPGGDDDVFRKLRRDFDAKGVAESDHQIRCTMDELMAQAVAAIKAGK